MNNLAYWSLRIGGFVAWNGHRKRNAKIKQEANMFLTIGLLIGFIIGWYVNEKFEDLSDILHKSYSKLKFWK